MRPAHSWNNSLTQNDCLERRARAERLWPGTMDSANGRREVLVERIKQMELRQ